jgi:hypothetical protein
MCISSEKVQINQGQHILILGEYFYGYRLVLVDSSQKPTIHLVILLEPQPSNASTTQVTATIEPIPKPEPSIGGTNKD